MFIAIAIQCTGLLALGLLFSYLLRRQPARAHAVLAGAVVVCLVLPLLWMAVRQTGTGLLAGPSSPAAHSDLMVPSSTIPLDVVVEPSRPLLTGSPDVLTPKATSGSTIFDAAHPRSTARSFSSADLMNWGVALWGVASFVLLVRLVSRFVRGRQLLLAGQPSHDRDVTTAWNQATRRMGVRAFPSVLVSPHTDCPAIWCWGTPTLVLPASMPAGVDWLSVMCHELAHARRRDQIWSLAADVLVCMAPWQPLAWWARRRIGLLSERACDEWALEGKPSSTVPEYAATLLAFRGHAAPPQMLAAVGGRSALAYRVRCMLDLPRSHTRAGTRWLSAVAGLACVVVVSVALAQPGAPAKPNTPPTAETPRSPEPATQPEARPVAKPETPATGDHDLELAALRSSDWRTAFGAANKLAALPPEEGFALIDKHWTSFSPEARQQTLKAWFFENGQMRTHPHLLDVLNRGATDPSTAVQGFAFPYLRRIAFRDFTLDFPSYRAWSDRNLGRPLEDVLKDSARDWAAALKSENPARHKEAMSVARDVSGTVTIYPSLRAEIPTQTLLEVARGLLKPGTSRELFDCARYIITIAQPDDEFLRQVVLPAAINDSDPALRTRALTLLGKRKVWAFEPLMQQLKAAAETGKPKQSQLMELAQSLADIGDPRAIPFMIAVIKADNTYDTVYGVGYFGLGELTGVKYDEKHDGAWWEDWWKLNKERFPADVQKMPIPELTAVAREKPAAPKPAANEEGVSSERLAIRDDQKKTYFLIGSAANEQAPAGGYRLLLILPGGGGGEDFNPFVQRVYKQAAPEGFVVAQLVAPVWDENKNRIVWPTTKSKGAALFSTEDFMREVIADVSARRKIDPKQVYALAWSSSGPAVYAALTTPDVPLAGAFVAMSVYKPDLMPALEGAKGRAAYILHSPDDKMIPMRFPQDAVKQLKEAGATTTLATYAGGHGWQGDVYGNIKTGLEWLISEAEKR